jgi:hypothetical protein
MKKLNREAKIFVNGKLAGILSEFRGGKNQSVVFQYEEGYLKDGSPIGSSFPLTSLLFV